MPQQGFCDISITFMLLRKISANFEFELPWPLANRCYLFDFKDLLFTCKFLLSISVTELLSKQYLCSKSCTKIVQYSF